MPPRLNTIPDPSLGFITCHKGMNTVDKPLMLDKSQCVSLSNMFPGKPLRLRNGMQDLFADNRNIFPFSGGADLHYHSEYTPYACYATSPNGDEYILSWIKTNQMYEITPDGTGRYYALEAINITNGERNVISYDVLKWRGETELKVAHFKFLKLHGVIYCVCDQETESGISPYIIYWDTKTDFWKMRGMGIYQSPNVVDVLVTDNNPIDTNNYLYRVGMLDNRVVVYNNRLYMTGHLNHVYMSEDGINWQRIGSLPEGKSYHSLIVFNGRIWVIGGIVTDEQSPHYGATHANVLSSTDGMQWTMEGDLPFSVTNHGVVVYQNRLCVIGGDHRYVYLDQVYSEGSHRIQYTYDGINWEEHVLFIGTGSGGNNNSLSNMSVAVYQMKLYIIGGYEREDGSDVLITSNKVWEIDKLPSSPGSIVPDQLNDLPVPLMDASTVVFRYYDGSDYEDCLLLCGGRSSLMSYSDKIYEFDGSDWSELGDSVLPTGHSRNPVTYYKGKLILSAGMYGYHSTDKGLTWQRAIGGREKGAWISLAYTYVRRTDYASRLNSYDEYTFVQWEVINNSDLLTGPDEKLLSGEVEWVTGTTLIGHGTDFTGELSEGDRIRINGMLESLEVQSITDDTHLTLVKEPQQPWEPLYHYRYALMPKVGDPVTTKIYDPGDTEGPEEPADRYVIQINSTTDFGRIVHYFPSLSLDSHHGLEKGITHLRIFSTLSADSEDEARGLTHGWVVDIAIKEREGLFRKHTTKYLDNTTDSEITANIATLRILSMTQEDIKYDPPPIGRYITWTASRVVIAGEMGPLYFSEVPGGDKAARTDNIMKYASMFSLRNYAVTSDQGEDQKRSGIETLFKDLIEFYEHKIYVLINSDLYNEPVCICDAFGCQYPNSIVKASHPVLGLCIFFKSTKGPAVVLTGNVVKLLSEFAIKELFPPAYDNTNTIDYYNNAITSWQSRNTVTAHYSHDTYWIHWGDSNAEITEYNTPKCYGYHIAPDGVAKGAMEVIVSNSAGYEPQAWVVFPNNRVLTLSHKTDAQEEAVIYKVTEFLRQGVIKDTFISDENMDGETQWDREGVVLIEYPYVVEVKTGLIPIAARLDLSSEIFALLIYLKLKNEIDNKLTIYITTDETRLVASGTYEQERQSGVVGKTTSADYRYKIKAIPKPGLSGSTAQISLKKVISNENDIELYGFALQVISRNLPCEFVSKISDLSSQKGALTFVAEVDKTPETDIYAEPQT